MVPRKRYKEEEPAAVGRLMAVKDRRKILKCDDEKALRPDWVPADWRMEVRRRKDGKKFKCYIDPTSDRKFYSKPEVLSHLQNVSITCSKSKKTMRRNTKKHSKKPARINCVVEKAVAQDLPPGWIKETRVRKKSREKKSDKYYIDPVSGRVFRSMKAVSLYLKTGEFVKRTRKSKDKDKLPAESQKKRAPKSAASTEVPKYQGLGSATAGEEAKFTQRKAIEKLDKGLNMKLTAEGERKKFPDNKIKKKVMKGQESKTGSGGEADKVPNSNASRDAVNDQQSGPKVRTKRSTTSPDNRLEKKRKESEFSGTMTRSNSLKMKVSEKLPPGDVAPRRGTRTTRHQNNPLDDESGAAIPCRSLLKRVAGGEVDQLPESKMNSREHVSGEDLSEIKVDASKNSEDVNSPQKHKRRVQIGRASELMKRGPILLPAGYLPLSRSHVAAFGSSSKRAENAAEPLSSLYNDFLTDPCIEIAKKTLTSAVPLRGAESHNPVCFMSNANPSSSPAFPCGDVWTDPCLEFAVKILTNEIRTEAASELVRRSTTECFCPSIRDQ